MIRALPLLVALSMLLSAAPPGSRAGKVSFLDGEATRSASGRPERLLSGSELKEGDLLRTGHRSRLELTLSDGSVIRLGPSATLQLETAVFGKTPEDRRVTVRLLLGNLWANVAKAVGGRARFEVKTSNAVAGVRGTTFRVDASVDRSVVVRVYSGTVAVAGGGLPRPEHQEGGPRHEVPGPDEVTREAWERIVTSMMEVRVSADGNPADPRAFELSPEDRWETFNRGRDLEEK